MLSYGVIINVVLAVLNLIPIPPLDGSRVAYWLLPDKPAAAYYRLEPYGMIIILALFGFGILGQSHGARRRVHTHGASGGEVLLNYSNTR